MAVPVVFVGGIIPDTILACESSVSKPTHLLMPESIDEQLRRVFDSLLERVQTEIRGHASDGLDQLHHTMELLRSREATLVEKGRAEAFEAGLRQGKDDVTTRLLAAIRSLDDATALSQTLEIMVSAVRRDARHAGIFLWRNDRLQAWGAAEFTSDTGQAVAELNPDDAGVIANAFRTGLPQLATSADRWPSFGRELPTGVFAAVPLIMSGHVIAVLCADHASASEGTHLAITCELLARHATQRLESLTAQRLAQMGSLLTTAAS
jgi:hypothetical protein